MLTYIKCAWANPFTRLGYLFLLIALYDLFVRYYVLAVVFGGLGLAILFFLKFGAATVIGYQMTRRRLVRNGGFTPFFLYQMQNAPLCVIVGFRLACNEWIKKQKMREARR